MPLLTAGRVANVCAGRLIGDGALTASRLVADSRDVDGSTAFVAVRGGHSHVADAVGSGAPFVVVERPVPLPDGAVVVVVDDSVRALGAIAADVRSSMDVRVVGITGSTGKTLTKDFVAAALGVRYRVHSAPSSYNNEIGVPLVVCGCPDDAEVIVAELAARHPGEIAELSSICLPEAGIVTGIGLSHVGEFGSRGAIARTKAELLDALPADGLAITPSDDDFLALFASRTSAKLSTVGPGGTVRYHAERIDSSGRTHGRVEVAGVEVAVSIPIPGRALLRNAAFGLCLAAEWGIDADEAARAIAHASTTGRRMEIVNIGPWTIVNDAWNANPVSTASALRSVRELAGAATAWAVLGEMAELGALAEQAHLRMGRLASTLGFAGVIVVGEAATPIAAAAPGIAHRVGDLDSAASVVRDLVPHGALVLVKGSRVTGLDRLPETLRTLIANTSSVQEV